MGSVPHDCSYFSRLLGKRTTEGQVRHAVLPSCANHLHVLRMAHLGIRPTVRGQISVPAFGHEKSPPLGADVQFLASVDRPPF